MGSFLSIKYALMLYLCLTAARVYVTMMGGWSSNRKYALMGAIRRVAQSISYEVRITLILLNFIFYAFLPKRTALCVFHLSFNLFLLIVLAETNRAPFDFSEGESELVRGFNTEYRSIPFLLLFLGEYMTILFRAIILRLLYNMTGLDVFIFFLF